MSVSGMRRKMQDKSPAAKAFREPARRGRTLVFALLAVNSVYLVAVTIWGVEYQNWFYLLMFALHLLLGAME